MKVITKFEADDGTEFYSVDACAEYEKETAEVEAIIAQLVPTPNEDSCEFGSGSGYIQQDGPTFLKVRLELLQFAKRTINHYWIQQAIDDSTVHGSWPGRIIDDCGVRALSRAWYRVMATDGLFREWGQVFYANHPEKATMKQLN